MKRIFVLLAALLLSLGAMAPASAGGPADHQTGAVVDIETGEGVGVARLVRTDSGVSYNLRTTGLDKGHATSNWWVIFNNPDACATEPCDLADLFVPAVDAAVMAGGGNAVGGSGRSSYAAHLSVGQITREHPAFEGGPGLTNPRGAEIHLVVRSHGPIIPGMNRAMFHSFEVGCTPETSAGFGDGPNECADLQVAVFLQP